jgi:hypothetical protein
MTYFMENAVYIWLHPLALLSEKHATNRENVECCHFFFLIYRKQEYRKDVWRAEISVKNQIKLQGKNNQLQIHINQKVV